MLRSARLWVIALVLLLVPFAAWAESVSTLPAPTNYVNDFAGVLSPATVQSMDALCRSLDRQAHAQIAVVTIHTIDPDKSGATPSIEEFATALEDKWKVGTKGTDRGVLMLLVMNPRRGRIEVGYGLEGILNDAKVGDIGRAMAPYARKNDYNDAVTLGVRDIASVIAADAGVTLGSTEPVPQLQTQQQPASISVVQWIVMIGIVLVLLVLTATGHLGILFWFLLNMLGAGRGGGGGFGGGGGDDSFGGFGGGSSGGGGASGDF
jgi:uncharacterized protein